jgi:hypothetical protein
MGTIQRMPTTGAERAANASADSVVPLQRSDAADRRTGSVRLAELTAREMRHLTLEDALELWVV